MKNFRLLTILGLALSLIFTSCSVEKRHYNKGYNVEWNSKAPKTVETAHQPKTTNNAVDNDVTVNHPPITNETKPAKTEKTAKAESPKKGETPKVDDSQSASAGSDKTPAKTVKPYEFKVKEGADLAKTKAKPFFAITMLKKAAEGNDILAILAFIFGILALFSYYASFLLALLAIIFGAIAMGRTSGTMHLLALLGLIFGIIAIFLWAGLFVFVL
jgi:hypothetical protein